MQISQSLNGQWQYCIGKGKAVPVTVPFSALPVGHSECWRSFDLQQSAEKILLQLDGITYSAKVYLNERLLGEMQPYCEYCFDITETVQPENNDLRVELEDISPAFGPTPGWENYGGIIRDVSILYRSKNTIESVFAHSSLMQNYTAAELVVETVCSCPSAAEFHIRLFDRDAEVLSYTQPAGEEFLPHRVEDIKLWSPDDPALYRLEVTLSENSMTVDTYTCHIGFREFTCDKHRFILNGRPLFLKGVCKHEMIGSSGHCPTEEQIEEDMLRIRDTGCNYVRLVHYPHNKITLDIADRIGLLVSEEPGLWWSDTANPVVSSGSLEVLKRTVLRDRNHPSVAFWLCFNECRFTEKFLIDSAATCRKYDPTRMVSGANCMSDEDTIKYFNLCNFDFYTLHPYHATVDYIAEKAGVFHDKPLMYTEWGGYFVYDNPKLISEFIGEMNRLYLHASDISALAGASFWCWAEVNDFNRSGPACIDGNQ